MNLDDITRMAREAGYGWSLADMHIAALERFAALVYEYAWKDAALAATRTVVDAAVLAEREACAKAVEGYCGAWDDQGYALTQIIRARSE